MWIEWRNGCGWRLSVGTGCLVTVFVLALTSKHAKQSQRQCRLTVLEKAFGMKLQSPKWADLNLPNFSIRTVLRVKTAQLACCFHPVSKELKLNCLVRKVMVRLERAKNAQTTQRWRAGFGGADIAHIEKQHLPL